MHSFIVEESLNFVKVFWLEQEKLIEVLFKIARKIGRANKNVLKIVLYDKLRFLPITTPFILACIKPLVIPAPSPAA